MRLLQKTTTVSDVNPNCTDWGPVNLGKFTFPSPVKIFFTELRLSTGLDREKALMGSFV